VQEFFPYFFAGVVGLIIGYAIDRVIKGRAHKTRDEILRDAERDADVLRSELELKLKDEELEKRSQLEAKMEKSRDQLREREREIDRSQSQLEEQLDSFRKKEKMLQGT